MRRASRQEHGDKKEPELLDEGAKKTKRVVKFYSGTPELRPAKREGEKRNIRKR